MKSDLQTRAEAACERFRHTARKPIVIEFAGSPKAGKSTTIGQVQSFLKRCGFRVRVVVERASVCPIKDKRHATFNVWTACTTLAQILENTQDPPRPDDPDVLILDRGLFDSICWLTMMERLKRITKVDREAVERFLLVEEWRARVSGVILMTVSSEEALRREQGHLPVVGTGSIMNPDVLEQVLVTTRACADRLTSVFRIDRVDTSPGQSDTPEKTTGLVMDMVLNVIEAHLAEDVLHVSKASLAERFGARTALTGSDADAVLRLFREEGCYRPREEVESDGTLVQALPVAVVQNRSGDILQLRRRERDAINPLHQKVVIWAGGHVRQEDAANGDPILHCLRRELNEELRLSIEGRELRYVGAVYLDTGGKTSQHAALVFVWQAKTDDVAVSLSAAEFFERRGTSLSGRFVPHRDLGKQLAAGKDFEAWSREIVCRLLPAEGVDLADELF